MNSYRLIIGPFAELDLQVAYDWYELQKEVLGEEFIEEVEKTIHRISQTPLQYSKVKKLVRMAAVKRFPYGIYFFIKEDIINVIAIFHFSRDPSIWKNRNK